MDAPDTFGDLGLSILGLGTEYPPFNHTPGTLEGLSKKFYPDSPAMSKVLAINRYTGIDSRSSIGHADEPLVNRPEPPSIAELHALFVERGVPLAVAAARKALKEAQISDPSSSITHVVATTCTDSANPGFDLDVAKVLGLSPRVERILLHGVGCSGGLASLRTAANLALGHKARGKAATVLCVALEVSTLMVRSELESIHKDQDTRIGAALFSDCASAAILGNDVGPAGPGRGSAVFDLLGWGHTTIPDTEKDLGFDVDPVGWKVVLSKRVASLTSSALPDAFASLVGSVQGSLPPLHDVPSDFDWATHPGGSSVLSGAERALGICPEAQRASYDRYINHGNSSSATIFSVMDRLREAEMDTFAPGGRPKEYVVACAFGPGISVETCMLRRKRGIIGATAGVQTPPESESDRSDRSESDLAEGVMESIDPFDLD